MKTKQVTAPFLVGAYVVEGRIPTRDRHPFNLPYVDGLDVDLTSLVTIFTGENGTGKSTLMMALAILAGLPSIGGSRNELSADTQGSMELANAMRPRFRARPPDSFYFRADALSDFGRLLEERKNDPDFLGDPYALYGGRSLKTRSHGEGVGTVLTARRRGGLFLFDEPEAALSPKRQVEFVQYIERSAATGLCQFILATHSPILMSIAGARLLDFNHPGLPPIAPTETAHWAVYKKLLCPTP